MSAARYQNTPGGLVVSIERTKGAAYLGGATRYQYTPEGLVVSVNAISVYPWGAGREQSAISVYPSGLVVSIRFHIRAQHTRGGAPHDISIPPGGWS